MEAEIADFRLKITGLENEVEAKQKQIEDKNNSLANLDADLNTKNKDILRFEKAERAFEELRGELEEKVKEGRIEKGE